MATTQRNLPAGGQLVDKAGKWTSAMWAWMRDISLQAAAAGPGTVTAVTASAPLASSGGTTPNISHNASGVAAGTYGDATHVAQVTFNATGHATSAGDVPITFPSADIQALLDSISNTQGAILYRNASDWVALNPGTSGQFLQTAGAAANPAWATVAASGTDYVLLGNGAQPPVALDNGAGSFIYVGYTP